MLPSTFVALRTQGLCTIPLRDACLAHFDDEGIFDADTRQRFWAEFVAARRSFRGATGGELEGLLARA